MEERFMREAIRLAEKAKKDRELGPGVPKFSRNGRPMCKKRLQQRMRASRRKNCVSPAG